jgi:hypothetical protein
MKRPISITIIGWLFIVGNSLMLVSGWLPPMQRLAELEQSPIESGSVHAVRILGIVCGVFMLRGRNWARWLTAVWVAFHVAISISLQDKQGVIVHGLLMAVIFYLLFRLPANAWFRSARAKPATKTDVN